MLHQLSIDNYRAFRHFELDEIALVNLIVGSNNSGKSSLLEAIYLLTNDNQQIPSPRANSRLITTKHSAYQTLASLWNDIILTSKETQVLEALQIIEPDIERISLTGVLNSRKGILLKLQNKSHPIPLSHMGNGLHRILAMTASLVSVKGGTLLIDDIDTGFYYDVLIDMWTLVLDTAQKTGTQVFATTHSWDCVQAFQQALTEVSDRSIGQLIRLEKEENSIEPVVYTAEELDIAMRQRIEVRWLR